MLEFYQAYTNYRGVMDLTQELIIQAAKDVTGGTKTKWGDTEIDWSAVNWRRMTMREAIIQYWPEAAGVEPPHARFAFPHFLPERSHRFNSSHFPEAHNTNKSIR